MIDLLPLSRGAAVCPDCRESTLFAQRFVLPGMMPLTESECSHCRRRYLVHLKIGFAANRELMVDVESGNCHAVGVPLWYADRLISTIASRGRAAPQLEIIRHRARGDDVILIDTLDPTYGHTLHSIFVCQLVREKNPKATIVVIVPYFAAWLVPDYVDEVWIVHSPLRDCHLWNDAVAREAEELLRTTKRVRLITISWFPKDRIAIEDFTRVEPMHFAGPGSVAPPKLTINWREDRCWTYLGRDLPREAAVADQHDLIRRLLRALRGEMPDLDVAVTGYGRTGKFDEWIHDMRIQTHDTETERQWVRRYGQSHVVFGVHGSNMLLPAAHAYSSVEIADPTHHQYGAWEWVNRMTAQEALLRYSGAPRSASLSDIATTLLVRLRRAQRSIAWHMPHESQIELLDKLASLYKDDYALKITDDNGRVL